MLVDLLGQDLGAVFIQDAGVVEVFADVHADDIAVCHGDTPSDRKAVICFVAGVGRTYSVLASSLL